MGFDRSLSLSVTSSLCSEGTKGHLSTVPDLPSLVLTLS